MSSAKSWCQSKAGATSEEVAAGDGCHPDEANALGDYLNGDLDVEEAATRITAPILEEISPKDETYRLWTLLCDALVELDSESRQKTRSLLVAIQALPSSSSSSGIDWSELPGFRSMWYDLYRSWSHGSSWWEKNLDSLDDQYNQEVRLGFAMASTAEAEMYMHGPEEAIGKDWGFDTLSLITSRRAGRDCFLSRIYPWLEIAGVKLKAELMPEETRSYDRVVEGSASGKWESITRTMAEHWADWKRTLLRWSEDGSELSEEGRKLAARCYELM